MKPCTCCPPPSDSFCPWLIKSGSVVTSNTHSHVCMLMILSRYNCANMRTDVSVLTISAVHLKLLVFKSYSLSWFATSWPLVIYSFVISLNY